MSLCVIWVTMDGHCLDPLIHWRLKKWWYSNLSTLPLLARKFLKETLPLANKEQGALLSTQLDKDCQPQQALTDTNPERNVVWKTGRGALCFGETGPRELDVYLRKNFNEPRFWYLPTHRKALKSLRYLFSVTSTNLSPTCVFDCAYSLAKIIYKLISPLPLWCRGCPLRYSPQWSPWKNT